MNSSPEPEWIDEGLADRYIGKVALVGVTYLDHNDKMVEQRQWAGWISEFSRERGIRIRTQDAGSEVTLPPDSRAIRPAAPGTYRLRSTGQVIIDPDYLITWTVVASDPQTNDESRR